MVFLRPRFFSLSLSRPQRPKRNKRARSKERSRVEKVCVCVCVFFFPEAFSPFFQSRKEVTALFFFIFFPLFFSFDSILARSHKFRLSLARFRTVCELFIGGERRSWCSNLGYLSSRGRRRRRSRRNRSRYGVAPLRVAGGS